MAVATRLAGVEVLAEGTRDIGFAGVGGQMVVEVSLVVAGVVMPWKGTAELLVGLVDAGLGQLLGKVVGWGALTGGSRSHG